MTDNEKRAHDLAVAMLPIIYDKDYKGQQKYGGDAYELYKDTYDSFLKEIKYDFPEE